MSRANLISRLFLRCILTYGFSSVEAELQKPAREQGRYTSHGKPLADGYVRQSFGDSLSPLLTRGLVQLIINLDLVGLKENYLTVEANGHWISSLLVL